MVWALEEDPKQQNFPNVTGVEGPGLEEKLEA
jgi:hypothetical protein